MMMMDSALDGKQGAGKKGKLSVLIVDDDPIVRRVSRMVLKNAEAEAEAEFAVNGMEAVDLCVRGASFDVIFMDLEMPVMDGIEATRKLREMGVESTIVGVTSRASELEIAGAFMGAGLNEFYGKPLTASIMQSLIRNISDRPKRLQRD